MNLWITVNSDGKYFATTNTDVWECGPFKRALRSVTKLLTDDRTIKRLVLPTVREHKRWSRVENPDHEELHKPLIRLLDRQDVELTVVPGLNDHHPWPSQKVALKKLAPRTATDNRLVIYTDGSCLGNPGFGGWGFASKSVSRSGGQLNVTNNAMEMTAVLEALKFFRKHKPNAPLKIISDSQYVIKGCTIWRHGWALKGFQGIANSELWKSLAREVTLADVEFFWVKGHNGTPGNEKADKLAGNAARAIKAESQR